MRTKKQIESRLKLWEAGNKHFSNAQSSTPDEYKYNEDMEAFTRHKVNILKWVLEDKDAQTKEEVFKNP